MSGPKVVRLVTREEIIAACQTHVASVDAALAAWERSGHRHGCVTEAEIVAHRARRERLAGLIKQERFSDLQKEAIREIEYLHRDREARVEATAQRAAAERIANRRRAEAASSLIGALTKLGRSVPTSLYAALQAAAQGQSDPAAMAAGFELLSSVDQVGGVVADQAVAARYAEGVERRRLEESLKVGPEAADGLLDRLESQIAELALHEDAGASNYEERLRAVVAEGNLNRRRMMADSLSLDLGRELGEQRVRTRLHIDLEALADELAALNDSGILLPSKREATSSELRAILVQVTAKLERHRAQRAAGARRRTMLEGLASLGYEVTEGMSTALAKDGELVLQSATRRKFGVEVSSLSQAQVQLRAVRFAMADEIVDPAADRDAETVWCQDVSTLQAGLARNGSDLAIVRALDVGATPLKRIALSGSVHRNRISEAPSKRQRLRRSEEP